MKLLMIGSDRKIFERGSAVALRQIEYAKQYEEVHIVVFANKQFKESVLGPNIWLYPTRSSSRWMYIFDALKLGRFVVEKRGITDVTCQDPFETGLVGALIKNREPVSLELQLHTDAGSSYFQKFTLLNRIRTSISRYTFARADTVRVVSERLKTYVSKYVSPEKITVRPIIVDVEKIKNAPITVDLHKKYPQFSKIVLMASRLEKEKNIEMAIGAWKMVLEKVPTAGLVIVGAGSEEGRLKSLVTRNRMQNSIIFEGWQNDIGTYYKTCDCFLVTSFYEGYGMTFVEAHAARTPIVSTDVGIADEVQAEIVEYTPNDIARGIIHRLT
jgi:glycosyltransferase involved in cell wall biosynthesis